MKGIVGFCGSLEIQGAVVLCSGPVQSDLIEEQKQQNGVQVIELQPEPGHRDYAFLPIAAWAWPSVATDQASQALQEPSES